MRTRPTHCPAPGGGWWTQHLRSLAALPVVCAACSRGKHAAHNKNCSCSCLPRAPPSPRHAACTCTEPAPSALLAPVLCAATAQTRAPLQRIALADYCGHTRRGDGRAPAARCVERRPAAHRARSIRTGVGARHGSRHGSRSCGKRLSCRMRMQRQLPRPWCRADSPPAAMLTSAPAARQCVLSTVISCPDGRC